MQRSAFGHQLKELLDALETVEMENVAHLKKLDKLVGDYILAFLSELDIMTTKDAIAPNWTRRSFIGACRLGVTKGSVLLPQRTLFAPPRCAA
jgi:hypothetical protein